VFALSDPHGATLATVEAGHSRHGRCGLWNWLYIAVRVFLFTLRGVVITVLGSRFMMCGVIDNLGLENHLSRAYTLKGNA
jgi:hypothetical protein